MKLIDSPLPGVMILEPVVFGDDRGFFMESWNAETFQAIGLDVNFVQDNHSRSAKGVLRGLHYQLPRPQGKLVRVVAGAAFDVAVDLRRSSANFGKWVGVELSAENKRLLWVPEGFAHGFLSLTNGTDFIYKCTDYFLPEHECCLNWDDPDIGIKWPIHDGDVPELSAKDRSGKPFSRADFYD